jgi:hypothetical protein
MDEILNCVSRALRGVGGKMTATRAQKLVPKCLETCPEEPGFLQKHEPRSVRLIGVFHKAQKDGNAFNIDGVGQAPRVSDAQQL